MFFNLNKYIKWDGNIDFLFMLNLFLKSSHIIIFIFLIIFWWWQKYKMDGDLHQHVNWCSFLFWTVIPVLGIGTVCKLWMIKYPVYFISVACCSRYLSLHFLSVLNVWLWDEMVWFHVSAYFNKIGSSLNYGYVNLNYGYVNLKVTIVTDAVDRSNLSFICQYCQFHVPC